MSTTEKAHMMRQVRTGKANVSEPLLKCRKRSDGNRNRGPVVAPGRARGIPVYCPGGCPAQRWREPGAGPGTGLERRGRVVRVRLVVNQSSWKEPGERIEVTGQAVRYSEEHGLGGV